MRVSTGYKVNTKSTRIHVRVLIYNTKPTCNEQVLAGGFAGTIVIPTPNCQVKN